MVSLTRNFGHQAAISAGLQHATGDPVVVMDADLQDPPEAVGRFIEKLNEGYDVVYAVRTSVRSPVQTERLLRVLPPAAAAATLDIPLDSGDFCVMSDPVVEAINALPERARFVRGLRTWVGFRQTGLAYERDARFSGRSERTRWPSW